MPISVLFLDFLLGLMKNFSRIRWILSEIFYLRLATKIKKNHLKSIS
ncbi:hypothetical protein HZB04_02710 [Candidatus Wolfebacteria bacterium]|nr:hypothetical protein [Candidatus Wolfebacteria bacterium]